MAICLLQNSKWPINVVSGCINANLDLKYVDLVLARITIASEQPLLVVTYSALHNSFSPACF